MIEKRSENSYINNDIIPFLNSNFGYPIHDATKVRINDVPIFNPSGGRRGTMDIVYYKDGVPLLLVEAKSDNKSHDNALKQALSYLKDFPYNRKEFSETGTLPKFLATTVGAKPKFYKWSFDYSHEIPEFVTEEIEVLPFEVLLSYYGLSDNYIPRILEPKNFNSDFFDELISIYKYHSKKEKITKNVVMAAIEQVHNYLFNPDKYTGNKPYVDLDLQGQKAVRDLFKRYDLVASLGPEIAKEFRKAILRSFQGTELNQYLTEKCVVDFMFGLLGKLNKRTHVLDFECGSGGFLAAAVDVNDLPLENIKGVDIDYLPYIAAKTYLVLYFKKHGQEILDIPVLQGNGLVDLGNNWDLVIGNPAGSSKYEHDDEKKIFSHLDDDLDDNGKVDKISEYNLSIQQAVQSACVGGRICLILPEGVFSNSQDEFLRKYIAKYCNIRAIISLPRGAFKRGTSTKRMKAGSQTASMKMSVLLAEKIREVNKKDKLEIDTRHLDYQIFLANISDAESKSGSISEWLEERLEVVLDQWLEWINKAELKNVEKISTTFDVKEKIKKRQKTLFEPVSVTKEENKITLKAVGVDTKVDQSLEGLL